MFFRDRSGNVALLFGLMLPLLMVGVGGGIEVSRAVEYKQRLTSATDLACRQAEVWVESTQATNASKNYASDVQAYADKNLTEKSLTATATITATPTKSSTTLTTQGVKPGNIHVSSAGSLDLVFKGFLNKTSLSFTVVRDCTVNASSSSGTPTLLLSESFEGYTSQLKSDGWAVFGTMSQANCESSLCQGKSWGTTNAGVEVDEIQAIQTGDGVQYGQAFAELDSDCNASHRAGSTTSGQSTACSQNGQTTNSSINMAMTLPVGTYEVRYVYTARKNVGNYQYPNDSVICSNTSDTDGLTRNNDVAKDAAGDSTVSLDGQTRRIELWVEPKTSGYKSDDQSLTASTNPSYMKAYMTDVCVWAKGWTERSYKFNVTSQQEYRISWRAAGLDDSFGGLIDYLRVCQNSCP